MRTVRDVMTARPVAVGPTDTVQTAVVALRTHGRQVLPVLDVGRIVGLVEAASLFMYQPDVAVADVMRDPVSLSPDDSLSSAAHTIRSAGVGELPVFDGEVRGFLTGDDLLEAWAIPTDPTTGLPWQDGLRMRAAYQLEAGHEMTVLFFDMDQFGALNKRWGHVVGDNALKAVATVLRERVHPDTDTPCRFGGDEFVVATTRPRNEAAEWALEVQETILGLVVEGLGEQLGVSVGIAGGLRRAGRTDVHAPANLDDLINRASRASTEAKASDTLTAIVAEGPPPLSPPATAPHPPGMARVAPPRPRIRLTESRDRDGTAGVRVAIERCGEIHTGKADVGDAGVAGAAAAAAVLALGRSLPSGHTLELLCAAEQDVGGRCKTVVVCLALDGPLGRQELTGCAASGSDSLRAGVKAVLAATNRVLETLDHAGPVQPSHPRAASN